MHSQYIALLVTILVRGSPGASTEQKIIPISAILSIISHHEESLNSRTVLLLSNLVLVRNFLTISRFSNVYLKEGGILKSQNSILSEILSSILLNLFPQLYCRLSFQASIICNITTNLNGKSEVGRSCRKPCINPGFHWKPIVASINLNRIESLVYVPLKR